MKTIIEVLEEKSLSNSFECNCCFIRAHNTFNQNKYKNIKINKKYPNVLTTVEIIDELGNIKKMSKEKLWLN